MLDFVKTDKTVVSRLIYLSTLLWKIKLTLLQLRRTMLMIRDLNLMVPNYKDLIEVEMQLIRRQDEIQNSCRLLLSPILMNIDFGHQKLNHWALSTNDIKRGYCELEEILTYNTKGNPVIFGRKYILLLVDHKDPILGEFVAGELLPLVNALAILDNIPEKKSVATGLYNAVLGSMQIALNYRTSKSIFKRNE